MKIGAHVSTAGGVWNAPENAAALGCETFQFFTRSPQGGPAPKLADEVVRRFRDACEKNAFGEYVVHAPYFINLASSEPRIRHGSVSILREELERSSLLGAQYFMTHLGSTKDVGQDEAMRMVTEGVRKILDGYAGSCRFLIEISAGAGMVIGDEFEELRDILRAVEGGRVGVCFDTQHAFASGYDLRTPEAVDETLGKLDETVGIGNVVMSHCNDSKVGLGERKDRHEHIGEGKIGLEGFRAIVNHPRLRDWLLIIETPFEGHAKDIENLKRLRKLRGSV